MPPLTLQPEVVTAVINHRINIASSVGELQEQIASVLAPVAEKYNLGLNAFGKDFEFSTCPMHAASNGAKAGQIILSEAFNSS